MKQLKSHVRHEDPEIMSISHIHVLLLSSAISLIVSLTLPSWFPVLVLKLPNITVTAVPANTPTRVLFTALLVLGLLLAVELWPYCLDKCSSTSRLNFRDLDRESFCVAWPEACDTSEAERRSRLVRKVSTSTAMCTRRISTGRLHAVPVFSLPQTAIERLGRARGTASSFPFLAQPCVSLAPVSQLQFVEERRQGLRAVYATGTIDWVGHVAALDTAEIHISRHFRWSAFVAMAMKTQRTSR